MKAEFQYDKRHYTCSLSQFGSCQELRIKNPDGLVLAVKQGYKTGLLGKKREEAKQVDISQPRFDNLIQAAIKALQLEELKQKFGEKNQEITNLHRQIYILKQEFGPISNQHMQQLQERYTFLEGREKEIKQREALAAQLQSKLIDGCSPSFSEVITTKIVEEIGNKAWANLNYSSKRELSYSYEQYKLLSTNNSQTSLTDYSEAAIGLCLVAEREVILPFFKNLYKFMLKNRLLPLSLLSFEIGGIPLEAQGKYTIGDLPPLLSDKWKILREDYLKQSQRPNRSDMYDIVAVKNRVSQRDRQLVKHFLLQWSNPLSSWLATGEPVASILDQIRQLCDRIADPPQVLYLWQFRKLWSLIIGGMSRKGILQKIYTD
ncbi:hypothetical protein [Lyngbya aestuarii]|uniref:hypothetical protein n=1 Tax=Lyngbya aestuarii TaxID=118322 RepID=UPI00403DBD58